MLAPGELQQLAAICTRIGNEAADAHGFVPVRHLLSRFRANLIIRPLLVEGMLASIGPDNGVDAQPQWAVLVDSDTNRVTELDVAQENHHTPLPNRLRNTIAHELVHSLAFRPEEFGWSLRRPPGAGKSHQAFVAAVERQTEKLSPLLLWPEAALTRTLTAASAALTVPLLTGLRRGLGISRYVLISRLGLLPLSDPNRTQPGLRNLAIGLAEWASSGTAVLRSWPLFINFERNVVPDFLHRLRGEDRLPAEAVFVDRSFVLAGGAAPTTYVEAPARVHGAIRPEKRILNFEVEVVPRNPGAQFLYAVTARQDGQPGR